jgi:tetratricopeptide (TPR) repeat protein
MGRKDDFAESLPEALRFFQLAIQEDPDLAPAHSGMSRAFNFIASVGLSPPKDIWPQVERWARSGLALDTTLAEAHLQLAEASLVRDWDWGEAERRIKRAIRLDPNSPMAHTYYMNFLLAQARMQEAEREFESLVQLDPLSSATLASRARFAFFARNFEDAVALAEILKGRDPTNLPALGWLGLTFMVSGHPEEVDRIYPVSFPELPKESAVEWAGLALYYSLTDAPDSAMATMDRVLSLSEQDYVDPIWIWPTYAAIGYRDEAFAWMERGIEAEAYVTVFSGVSPLADPLRDDPRYQAILDRLSLGHLKARFDSLAAARPTGGP